MAEHPDRPDGGDPVPPMQRLFDNVWLLLVLGLVIMIVIYTAWGLYEVTSLPTATLP